MLAQVWLLSLGYVLTTFLSAVGVSAQGSVTKTLEPANIDGLDPMAQETEVVYVQPSATTFTVGEVFLANATSSFESDVESATATAPASGRPSRVSAPSNSPLSLASPTMYVNTTCASSSSSSVDVEATTSSVFAVTTLLTKSKSTSTSMIFSTTKTLAPSVTAGTTVTTIQTKPQPLVTQAMVSSQQSVTVTWATLVSDVVVAPTGLTSTQVNSMTTFVVTSLATSPHASAKSSPSANPTAAVYRNSTTTSIDSTDIASSNRYNSTLSLLNSTFFTEVTVVSTTQVPTVVPTNSATLVDLFVPVATSEPNSVFQRVQNPLNLASGVDNGNTPYETNKFYTNLIVGSQESGAFVYPYVIFKNTNGIGIQHTKASQQVVSSTSLVNPLGISSFIVTSAEFASGSSSMNFKVTNMFHSSCDVQMVSSNDASDYIESPLVQGMGFVSSIFHGKLTPQLQSSVGFSTLSQETSENLATGILKYRVTLLNGVDWLVYVTLPSSLASNQVSLAINNGDIQFTLNNGNAYGDGMIIQIAEAPNDSASETYYDSAAGMYLKSMDLSGTSDGNTANFKFSYETEGTSASGATVIFTLPHHSKSLTSNMQQANTGIEIASTTKGNMTGFLTTELEFETQLNANVNWLPWSEQKGSNALTYTSDQLQLLAQVANDELQVNIKQSIQGLNTYYLGKVLDKYAFILLTVSDIIKDSTVAKQTLELMKEAFAVVAANQQLYPLDYDTKYGGIISSGDLGSTSTQYDFGNTYYNDHHFHYGYIIHAAAVIGHVDQQYGSGDWASENKDIVEALIRDVANPSLLDTYFPQFRSFDWFNGHSWAAGLYENGNGKNEESSSEDYHFAYGMKLWGEVTNNESMNRLGSLMLNILRDSMQDYFLYTDDNTVEPSLIVANKVSGILFDNIIDYTTYFGTNTEYIHGIHMLPLTPASGLIRSTEFVQQEWNEKLASIIDSLQSGWAGILRLNQALFDPKSSYDFFSQSNFDSTTYLDNGMSRTWALAYAGGLQS